MILSGIILLVAAGALGILMMVILSKTMGATPQDLASEENAWMKAWTPAVIIGLYTCLPIGLFFVIFGTIYGKKLDRKAAALAEQQPNVSFTNDKEYTQFSCTLADVQIVNTNQLLINNKTINMSSLNHLFMDRQEIRFKDNNTEYIISYQNTSEATFLVSRIKQYSK